MNSHFAVSAAPDHIPEELIFDFDIHGDSRITEKAQGSYAATLADAPEIFCTRFNGGHWIIKSFDGISQIATDPEHFSAREMQFPRAPSPPKFIPLNLDPPDNLPYLRAKAPMFGPVAVKALEHGMRELAASIVATVAKQGQCEFQAEVAKSISIWLVTA